MINKTPRGFEIIRFQDANGRECCLQQSAAFDGTDRGMGQPGSSFVWLGLEGCRMHLDREDVKELLDSLKNWLDDGSF